LGGLDRRTSWGGLAMNTRGAMEMILGLLALQAGLIKDSMFVALVVMALFTSMISAPAIHYLIRSRKTLSLKSIVSGKLFLPNIDGHNRKDILEQMCRVAADSVSNAPERFLRLVMERGAWHPAAGKTAWRFPMRAWKDCFNRWSSLHVPVTAWISTRATERSPASSC
ncbi:MAG: hypothetical protein ACREQC_08250, partial [Candidatus Binataceae bacterium]